MFEPDTPLVQVVVPARGYRRRKFVPRLGRHAIVIHTAGRGVLRRAVQWQMSPFEATLRVYRTMMDACGHYVVGQQGEIGQTCPEREAAWGVGSHHAAVYTAHGVMVGRGAEQMPRWAASRWLRTRHRCDARWWARRWPDLVSPLELGGGSLWTVDPRTGALTCNGNVIHVEVVPPEHDPAAPWSSACWSALVRLVDDIATRSLIPVAETRIVTHSDAHPLARSTKRNAPWDPPPSQWTWVDFVRAREHFLRPPPTAIA